MLGFVVLLAGTSIYNELLKSFLPSTSQRRRRAEQQVKPPGRTCTVIMPGLQHLRSCLLYICAAAAGSPALVSTQAQQLRAAGLVPKRCPVLAHLRRQQP